MTSPRLWLTWLVIAAWPVAAARAQQSATSSGSSSTPPSPATGSAPGFPPGNGPAPASPATGAPAGFGTGIGTGTPAETGQPAGTEIPSAKPLDTGPTTFSISTGYGKAPVILVSGEGRLARPKFQTRLSASIGFDDNIFQTPTDAQGTPEMVIPQQVTAGTQAQVVQVQTGTKTVQGASAISPTTKVPVFGTETIPAQPAQFRDIVIPGTPAPSRQASAISRESVSFEAQTASRLSVFTFDFNFNTDYYWNRPGKKIEYNGNLAIRYLHRFTPRLQMTASADISYLSQPDLSQINTPRNTGNGNYFVTTSKADLSYRWTPRFSTVTSASYSRLDFEEKLKQIGNYSNITLGTEFRYLWSPKMTLVLEGRYGHISYPENSPLDSASYYALGGLDVALTRRASGTIRAGEAVRVFDESGQSSSAPYLETTLTYLLSKASVVSWNNRFGFEEPPDPNTEVLSFRSGLAVTHFFSPRLRGSLSVNGIYRSSKNKFAHTDSTEETIDSGVSLLYTFTRQWSLSLSYDYTTVFFDPGPGDYFRDHVFAEIDYSF